MNHDIEAIIQNALDADETLIWCGIPKQGLVFRRSDYFMLPFSLLLFGGAVCWESLIVFAAIDEGSKSPSIIFQLFGIIIVMIALYMVIGRFIYDKIKRANIVYGISNLRAIIVSDIFGKNVTTIDLRLLLDIDIAFTDHKEGYGTITFAEEDYAGALLTGMWWRLPGMGGTSPPRFDFIENGKEVFSLLMAQKCQQ